MSPTGRQVKASLRKSLDDIGNGTFAASGPVPNAVNPGLVIEGLGNVGLPLSERDAAELCRVGHQAPFGKGTETVVDTSIRKTWELNANQVKMRNPAWKSTLNGILDVVKDRLGIIPGTEALLHKLLLYEPGAFFHTHRDSEKAPGMFATLVVALPSGHTGGDVLVKLGSQQKTLASQQSSDFGYSYLAWYADVSHSVEEVTSGYRLVLTYNLINSSGGTDTLTSSRYGTVLDDHQQKLEHAFDVWKAHLSNEDVKTGTDKTNNSGEHGCDEHSERGHSADNDRLSESEDESNSECGSSEDEAVYERLIYTLDHRYSEENIGMGLLKGHDQLRAHHLLKAAIANGCHLFFAHFEYWREFHDDEEEDDFGWWIKALYAPSGECVAEELPMNESMIVQHLSLSDYEPDEEEHEVTGNEGENTTHFYRRSCMIIVPGGSLAHFLTHAKRSGPQPLLKIYLKEMARVASHVGLEKLLLESCDIATSSRYSQMRNKYIEDIVRATLRLDKPLFLERLFPTTANIFETTGQLSTESFSSLGLEVAKRELKLWLPAIQTILTRYQRIPDYTASIGAFLESYKANIADPQGMLDLEKSLLSTLAKAPTLPLKHDDAKILLGLNEKHGEDFMEKIILPTVRKMLVGSEMLAKDPRVVVFLKSVSHTADDGTLATEVARSISNKIIADLLSSLRRDFKYVQSPDGEIDFHGRYHEWMRNKHRWESSRPDDSGVTNFVDLLQISDRVADSTTQEAVVHFLIDVARQPATKAFENFLFPLLAELLPSNASTNLSHYQTLFTGILKWYIHHCGNPKPDTLMDDTESQAGLKKWQEDEQMTKRQLGSLNHTQLRVMLGDSYAEALGRFAMVEADVSLDIKEVAPSDEENRDVEEASERKKRKIDRDA